MDILASTLVPIFICVVLPVAIVFIVSRSVTNRENKRAEVLIKAIEANNGIDADKLAESIRKPVLTTRELLNARLLRGCIFSLLGVGMAILGVLTQIYEPSYHFIINAAYILCAVLLPIGISYLIVYFITRKQVDDTDIR